MLHFPRRKRSKSILNVILIICSILLVNIFSSGLVYGSWFQVVEHAEFSPRDTAEGVVFLGKMWLSNGWHNDGPSDRELWSSEDGAHWTKMLDQTPYDEFSEMVVYNGKLWAISNSVWCSENGIDWVRVLENTPFGARSHGEVVVHDGRMWQLGSGEDVWWSTDGVNWTCATPHAPFGDRYASAVTVFNGRIWLMGGATYRETPGDGYYPYLDMNNDVWSSEDGTNWTLMTEHASWKGRMWFVGETYRDRLWVMGGFDNDDIVNFADAWYTFDGVNWHKYESATWWLARHEPTPYVFNSSFWIVAGTTYPMTDSVSTNDVWRLTANYFIIPTTKSFGAAGGVGSVMVTTPIDYAWTVIESLDWVTIISGSSGVGNGTVSFSVTANKGSPRQGILTIADQTFTVNQSGISLPWLYLLLE